MSEPEAHLQQPCMICGTMVDLPALWACPCGAWRLCYRSACQLRIPKEHRDGVCGADSAEGGGGGRQTKP